MAALKTIPCPSCGKHKLRHHCPKGYPCRWVKCAECDSFGILDRRWYDAPRQTAFDGTA